MKSEKFKDLRYARFDLRRDDKSRKAGSNSLSITTRSDDWRSGEVVVKMSLRDARALRDFLNKNLEQ